MDTSIYRMLNLLFIFIVFIGHPALSIYALFSLRKRALNNIASAVWTLIILLIPILGVISLWLVNPKGRNVNS